MVESKHDEIENNAPLETLDTKYMVVPNKLLHFNIHYNDNNHRWVCEFTLPGNNRLSFEGGTPFEALAKTKSAYPFFNYETPDFYQTT